MELKTLNEIDMENLRKFHGEKRIMPLLCLFDRGYDISGALVEAHKERINLEGALEHIWIRTRGEDFSLRYDSKLESWILVYYTTTSYEIPLPPDGIKTKEGINLYQHRLWQENMAM